MPEELSHSNSFVVRIWWEKQENEPPLWRGWAQHAASGESRYFGHMADLVTFLESLAGPVHDRENLNEEERI